MTNLYVFKTKKTKFAELYFQANRFECIIGSNGIGNKIREGDHVTPRGIFKFKKIFYRPDRVEKFKANLPVNEIKKNSFWCVDSRSSFYNQYSNEKNKFKSENLFRNDHLYDVFISINFNINPTIKYKGSAIFLHCFEKKKKFTEGCVAIQRDHLIEIAKQITPSSKMIIT